MTRVVYEIVQHEGGWAYRVAGTYSEAFPTHDLARRAAERAAREQTTPDHDAPISWEDEQGRWRDELASGKDRPTTEVEG
jgi:hypothetical protein